MNSDVWHGILQECEGFVAILPGANVPVVLIRADSEKLALRRAREYQSRIPETDWNATDILHRGLRTLKHVTDVRATRRGVVLHGLFLLDQEELRYGCIRSQQADDGRWIEGDGPAHLLRYYQLLEIRAERRRWIASILTEEDEAALFGGTVRI